MLTFTIFLILSILLSGFALVPLFKAEAWWIRAFDFPRLQSWYIGLALLILELLMLDLSNLIEWLPIGITALFILAQSWWIYPYTKACPKEVLDCSLSIESPRIKLLCANVLMPNRQAAKLLEQIKKVQPDLFVTLESDKWWEEQLAEVEADYPHQVKCPLDNLYGMHVYSKLPFTEQALRFLVEDDVPSIHILVKLDSGETIRFHFLHPAPPAPAENDESTERDAELIQVARYCKEQADKHDLPVVVAGDLNDVAWSSTTRLFRKLSGLLDPRIGRGMFNSFHAKYWLVRWPLDHVFHSDHFTVVNMQRLPAFGSDHFPILVELALQPRKQDKQNGLEADTTDHAWADEKLTQMNKKAAQ